jgi:hypothetical protein
MLVYVAHEFGGKKENVERAKKITHDLQIKDMKNAYICPLFAFSHLDYCEVGYDEELELCVDLLSVCDKLIVASGISRGVEIEIGFANLVGMEVEYLEDSEQY